MMPIHELKLGDALARLGFPRDLIEDLAVALVQMRQDVRKRKAESVAPGKFVETVVQVLQHLDPARGGHDLSVKSVDVQLLHYEQRDVAHIPADSRLLIVRAARLVYTLRNKRSFVHKNGIDPSHIDAELALRAAQWILAEFVRVADGSDMVQASALIGELFRPVVPVVDVVLGRPIVMDPAIAIEDEILLVMAYLGTSDGRTSRPALPRAMPHRPSSSVRTALKRLSSKRLVEIAEGGEIAVTAAGLIRLDELHSGRES